jgi:hypothetical protein
MQFHDFMILTIPNRCRKISGSTYVTALMVPDSDFTSSGSIKTFTTKHEVGMPITVSSCAECGTMLWKEADGWPNTKLVFAGTLDGVDALNKLKPDLELWSKYKVDWVGEDAPATLEAFPGEWDREGGKWVEVKN